MKVCHDGIHRAFEKVCTRNQWPSKQDVWFDYLDGFNSAGQEPGKGQEIKFTIRNGLGQNGVHRAHFLDEMVRLIPEGIARFNKHLDTVAESDSGRMAMRFSDGSVEEADVVIGCDGIKSKVRGLIVGEEHPSATPSFTHKYAYRGLVPMEKAIEAIGEELASNSCMHVSFVPCALV